MTARLTSSRCSSLRRRWRRGIVVLGNPGTYGRIPARPGFCLAWTITLQPTSRLPMMHAEKPRDAICGTIFFFPDADFQPSVLAVDQFRKPEVTANSAFIADRRSWTFRPSHRSRLPGTMIRRRLFASSAVRRMAEERTAEPKAVRATRRSCSSRMAKVSSGTRTALFSSNAQR